MRKSASKMREVVINDCYGGFGLSHKAMMRYAKLKKIKLYPYIADREDGRLTLDFFIPYTGQEDAFVIHYLKSPLKNGKWGKRKSLSSYDIPRDDSILIKVVKELGKDADGDHAELKIVKVPRDVKWSVEEYDGLEHIAESHRTWS